MNRRILRGLERKHEQNPEQLLRDTRTFGQKLGDFYSTPSSVAVMLFTLAAAGFLFSWIADILFLFSIGSFIWSYSRRAVLPFRLPMGSDVPDYNDLKPGSDKPHKARGICFFGNERSTNAELWFNDEDMRTHVLIFGSTGSGKTETLVSLAYNALVMGSGFIYVDGKGDNSLFSKVFSMARKVGREDDVLLVNFMTGARDIIGPQETRLSNTLNPFANGSSSMLSQLVVSLMESSAGTPDGDMWKGRAISFVEALMKILTYARDQGYILLDANVVRNYFELYKIEPIVLDKIFLRDGQESVSLEGVPDVVIEPIKNYIINLPGWDRSKKGKQGSQVLEQHGFITMQLTRVFTSLADTYGHIMRHNLAEVDMRDVVLNRRILCVLLPAMEKSPDELSNLGKVIVATLKAMMAAGLGDEVEGEYRDLIERKPTNAKTPFLCILDEYGYYAVKGFAVVPAQARSLGFSAIFAGQDLPAFQKASKEEAASIGANTNIKIAMKLEDPIETWEFFAKTAGESFVTKVDSFQTNPQQFMNNYLDARSSSVEKRARIDLLDLKDQEPGEAHLFFKSSIVRYRTFYASPKPVNYMRLNHFLKVEPPPNRVLALLSQRVNKLEQMIQKGDLAIVEHDDVDDIDYLTKKFSEAGNVGSIEKAVKALIDYSKRDYEKEMEMEPELDEPPLDQEVLDQPSPPLPVDSVEEGVVEPPDEMGALSVNIFSRGAPFGTGVQAERPNILLSRSMVLDNMIMVERMSGKTEQESLRFAREVLKDLANTTAYPPKIVSEMSGDALVVLVGRVIEKIEAKKTEREKTN